MGIGEEGSAMSMDMNMKMSSESEAIRDSASHTVSTVSASILGQEMEEKTETYTIPEDGKTKVYTLSNDSWYVETAEAEESVDAAEEMDKLLDMISDGSMKAELGKETEKVNGKDSYVLTLTLDTEGLKDIMSMSRRICGCTAGSGRSGRSGFQASLHLLHRQRRTPSRKI